MSVKIASRVWEQSPQKDSRLLLTLALADNANDDGICWPSTDYLRDKIRMSKRQTQRLLDKLEETAEIWVSRPEHNGPNAPNHYIVLSGMTDEQILNALEDLGVAKSGDKKTGDILGSGDILNTLKQKRVTFLHKSGDIRDLENLPDFSVIGKREEVRRKRTTVRRTVKKKEPSDSLSEKSPKEKPYNPPDLSFERLSLECFNLTKHQIGKTGGRVAVILKGRTGKNATLGLWRIVFGDKIYTPERDRQLADELSEAFKWYRDKKPGMDVPASDTTIWKAISDYRDAHPKPEPEKPFDIETDPDNPKNWSHTPRDLVGAYQNYKKALEKLYGIYDYNPPELHQSGREDQISSSPGTNGTQSQQPGQSGLSLVSEHGGSDPKRAS